MQIRFYIQCMFIYLTSMNVYSSTLSLPTSKTVTELHQEIIDAMKTDKKSQYAHHYKCTSKSLEKRYAGLEDDTLSSDSILRVSKHFFYIPRIISGEPFDSMLEKISNGAIEDDWRVYKTRTHYIGRKKKK